MFTLTMMLLSFYSAVQTPAEAACGILRLGGQRAPALPHIDMSLGFMAIPRVPLPTSPVKVDVARISRCPHETHVEYTTTSSGPIPPPSYPVAVAVSIHLRARLPQLSMAIHMMPHATPRSTQTPVACPCTKVSNIQHSHSHRHRHRHSPWHYVVARRMASLVFTSLLYCTVLYMYIV